MNWLTDHILTFLIFCPLLFSGLILGIPNLNASRWISMIGALVTFVGSLYLWIQFDGSSASLQFTEQYKWIPDFGISYFVGIDGLSLLLVMLTTFLAPLVILSQWHIEERRQRYFFALIMSLESMMLGALLAIDLVFFYVFWEAMLIPMYFIIGLWGGANRIYATMKFFLYTVFGSLLMLAAALAMYHYYVQQFGSPSTNLIDLYKLELPRNSEMWLFAAFALAFAIKVPMWPFHTWLPDAHVQAPTTGSVILAGVLLKMGTYGFIRFAIPLFPEATVAFAPVLVTLGIVGIIYGALVAWVQVDAKKLVAYSSVSHLGFVVIGSLAVMAGGASLSEEALTGAIYQMINHGISTGALFFLVGVIYERRHTRMMADFGGLASVMPYFSIIFIVATLSSVGLPGTGGFVGEFLILLGTFQSSPIAGIFAVSGVLLGAVYMLTLVKALLFGPVDKKENADLKDLNAREISYLLPLAALAVIMGIYPNLFLDKIRPSIQNLSKNFKSYELTVGNQSAIDKGIVARTYGLKGESN